MTSPDRLDELETYQLGDDTPGYAKVRIPAEDLRDLVSLIPALRAAIALRDAVVDAVITKRTIMEAVVRFDGERAGGGE